MVFQFFKRTLSKHDARSKYSALAYERDFALRAQNLSPDASLLFACCAAQRLFAVYEQGTADVPFWNSPELKVYLEACWQILETGRGIKDIESFNIEAFMDGQKAEAAYLLESVGILAMIIDKMRASIETPNIAVTALTLTLDFLDGALDEYVFNNPHLWKNPPEVGTTGMTGPQSVEYSNIVFGLPLVQTIISYFERDLTILTESAFDANLVGKLKTLAENESVLRQARFVPLQGLVPLCLPSE